MTDVGLPMGRKPHLTPEEAQEVRDLYNRGSTKWKVSQLARAFQVSMAVIQAALNRTGAYRRSGDD